VAFVPGKFFYVNHEDGAGTLCMNFTAVDEESIERAVSIVGDAIAEELDAGRPR
jgi:DNA-binding transcriptional MocR family regulator